MVCLDTSFLIDLIRGKEEIKKIEEILGKKEESIAIASPSIVEIFKGLYLKKNLANIKENEFDIISEILSSMVILNLDKKSAVLAGKIEADSINKGQLIDLEDIMIGAIAITNNEVLLTRNKKHFEKIKGLKIEGY